MVRKCLIGVCVFDSQKTHTPKAVKRNQLADEILNSKRTKAFSDNTKTFAEAVKSSITMGIINRDYRCNISRR